MSTFFFPQVEDLLQLLFVVHSILCFYLFSSWGNLYLLQMLPVPGSKAHLENNYSRYFERVLAVFRASILRVLRELRVFRAFILWDTSLLAVLRGTTVAVTPCTWSIWGFDTPEYCLYLKYFGVLHCSYWVLAAWKFSECAVYSNIALYFDRLHAVSTISSRFLAKPSQTVPRVLVEANYFGGEHWSA